MIRADQIPPEVVEAAAMILHDYEDVFDNVRWRDLDDYDREAYLAEARAVIAAALNAWPDAKPAWFLPQGKVYMLPAPWENKKSEEKKAND